MLGVLHTATIAVLITLVALRTAVAAEADISLQEFLFRAQIAIGADVRLSPPRYSPKQLRWGDYQSLSEIVADLSTQLGLKNYALVVNIDNSVDIFVLRGSPASSSSAFVTPARIGFEDRTREKPATSTQQSGLASAKQQYNMALKDMSLHEPLSPLGEAAVSYDQASVLRAKADYTPDAGYEDYLWRTETALLLSAKQSYDITNSAQQPAHVLGEDPSGGPILRAEDLQIVKSAYRAAASDLEYTE